MARSNRSYYTQTAIGDCGHVCSAWPLLGTYKQGKHVDLMFCETCMREQNPIPEDEAPIVMVRVVRMLDGTPDDGSEPAVKKPARKRAPAKKAAPKVKKMNPWDALASVDVRGEIL